MNIHSLIQLNASVTKLLANSVTKIHYFNLIRAVVRGKLHETSHSRILGELLRCDSGILKSFWMLSSGTGFMRRTNGMSLLSGIMWTLPSKDKEILSSLRIRSIMPLGNIGR